MTKLSLALQKYEAAINELHDEVLLWMAQNAVNAKVLLLMII